MALYTCLLLLLSLLLFIIESLWKPADVDAAHCSCLLLLRVVYIVNCTDALCQVSLVVSLVCLVVCGPLICSADVL